MCCPHCDLPIIGIVCKIEATAVPAICANCRNLVLLTKNGIEKVPEKEEVKLLAWLTVALTKINQEKLISVN